MGCAAVLKGLSRAKREISSSSKCQTQNYKAVRSTGFDNFSKLIEKQKLQRTKLSETFNKVRYVVNYKFSEKAQMIEENRERTVNLEKEEEEEEEEESFELCPLSPICE